MKVLKKRPKAPHSVLMVPVDRLVPTPDNKRRPITQSSVESLAKSLARFGGVYLDTDVKPIRPLDEMCPAEVVAWAACEQLDIVSNAAMGFPLNHPAMWHAVAMIEESFFERRYVGDQAGPGLLARVVT